MKATGNIVCLVLIFGALVAISDSKRLLRHGRPTNKWGKVPPPSSVVVSDPDDDNWFSQKLDHFDAADNTYWSQRYQVNDLYYQTGGPVFLNIGGEGAASASWMTQGQWIVAAEQFNALCFQLEHRYYGESHPTDDVSVENLIYLSSEQALADIAYFIQQMTANDERVANASAWIVFGGSYSGNLAAWARYNYPHLIHAAVASSAPVFAQTDFYGYEEVVQQSVDYYDSTCSTNIASATQQLTTLVNSESWDTIIDTFSACSDFNESSEFDIATLFEGLADNFNGVVQYNLDNRAFEGAVGTNITVADLCQIMADETIGTELDRYAAVNQLIMDTYEEDCLDVSYAAMIEELQSTSWDDSDGGRTWFYQTCTEFGYYQTTDSQDQPFGQTYPLNYYIQQCIDVFGSRYNRTFIDASVDWTNSYYGARDLKVAQVAFPNGNIDPWHYLGITSDLNEYSPAIFIDGTAHCADMYPSRDSDSDNLIQARQQIMELLSYWLSDSVLKSSSPLLV